MIIYIWKYELTEGQFIKKMVIDNSQSVIWVTRYNECGEFEICLPADKNIIDLIASSEIMFTRDDSESAMLLEKIRLTTDEENGDTLILSGRTLESILARRVVCKQTQLEGTAESGIRQLLTENVINPKEIDRKIKLFRLYSESDQWGDKLSMQVTGTNLLETVVDICKTFDYGFKVLHEKTALTFYLYKGSDVTDKVIFSPEFGNLASTEFSTDYINSANLIYVAGEGEGSERKIVYYESDDAEEYQLEGIFRKEYWKDQRDCSSKTDTGELLPAYYLSLLHSKGKEFYYSSLRPTTNYSGEIISNYKYRLDYNLGDKVKIVNEYGIKATATITEITEVEDENGYSIFPTLSEWMVI